MNKQDRIKSNKLREEMFGGKKEALDALLGENIKPTKEQILKEEIYGEISNSEDLQDTRK